MKKDFKYHSDYSLFLPGKSWMFVNPSHGCPLKCSYCVEQKDRWFENKVTPIYSAGETIENVLYSSKIVKDSSPLTFYNFSDPFLPENKKDLLSILGEMDRNKWKNKIGLITKLHPGKEYLEKLSELENLKLGLFVSYVNLIPGLENVSYERRVELMKDSKDLGIKTIDYVRPLVSEWTNKERIEELANQIVGNVDAVSLSGIRLTPEIINSLELRGLPIPIVRTYLNKQREDNLFQEVTEILKEKTGVPVFWHTSCAMSYVSSEFDYNSHDIREKMTKDSCGFPCEDNQREKCYSRKGNSSEKKIRGILKKIGKGIDFRRDNETIFLRGDDLKMEDISLVRHLLPEFVMKDEEEEY